MLTPPVIPATQSATAIHTLPLTEAIVIENSGAPLAEDGCQFVDAADSSTTTTNTAGLSIAVSGNDCHITGTPRRSELATAGTPEVVMLFIRAFNAEGSDWTTLTLTINPAPPDLGNLADSFELTLDTPTPTITFANASDGTVTSNGCNISPALPAGLTLAPTANNQSCRITGTPTHTLATTTYTVTASDGITPDPTPARLTLAVRLPAMQIQTGRSHSCLLNPTGEIWCWGDNTNGQLGTGDNLAREIPTRVGGETNWRSLTVGSNHNCAINASAQLYCWGLGSSGQLGQGADDEGEDIKNDQNTPTRVGTNNDWHSVGAGTSHTCGIRGNDTDRTLYCWGEGSFGRLGTGNEDDKNVPTQVTREMPENGEMGGYTDWHSVSAGTAHTCGIREDGVDRTLYCWGLNRVGQLGAGATGNQNTPVQEMDENTDWLSVSVGGQHTCGVRRNSAGQQSLWCWGWHVTGQLGVGNIGDQDAPAQVMGMYTDWHSVSAGGFHTCGIRRVDANRTLWCWGEGANGRIGTGNSDIKNTPTQVVGMMGTTEKYTDWHSVSAGLAHTCGIREDGAGQTLWCWGGSDSGQLGTGDTTTRNTPTRVDANTDWHSVSGGEVYTCGIREEGGGQNLYCWGEGGSGQLGTGGTDDQTEPTRVGDKTDWHSVSAGTNHTCGIREEDSNQNLYCWGEESSGRLGIGESNENQIVPTRVGAGTDWHSISAGLAHTCGIRHEIKVAGTEQNLYCWGVHSNGRLGIGATTENQTVPARVGAGTDWHSVSVTEGGQHTCGIREESVGQTLYCWGVGSSGRLGAGEDTSVRNTPNLVMGGYTDWHSVSAGEFHTCGIRADQTLWCWGRGSSGQLGTGDTDDKNAPTQVMGGYTDWHSVSAGDLHTCGIREESAGQTLWCWGLNRSGRLGTGSFTTRLIPRPVPGLTTPSLVDSGDAHSCAISTVGSDNSLFCWGDVSNGRLGIGDIVNLANRPRQTLFAIESLVTPTTLGDALDTDTIAFNLLGTRSWVTQTEQANDNTDAAAITTAVESELACITASTSNAGSLSFFWRVSSDRDSDFLNFYLDAFETQSISGMVDWVKVDVPGVFADTELRWCYEKDDNDTTANEDGAFLDQVVFTPAPPAAP